MKSLERGYVFGGWNLKIKISEFEVHTAWTTFGWIA